MRLHSLLLRPFFCILLLLLIVTTLPAQAPYYEVNSKRNQVIAISGLNLRDAPGAHGRILTKVPFRDQVEILSDSAFAYINDESQNVREQNYAAGPESRELGRPLRN